MKLSSNKSSQLTSFQHCSVNSSKNLQKKIAHDNRYIYYNKRGVDDMRNSNIQNFFYLLKIFEYFDL